MMNETVAINQNLEKDVRGLDTQFLSAPSESDSTLALEFPWTHLAKDVQFSSTRCLNNATDHECIASASTDIRPYAPANNAEYLCRQTPIPGHFEFGHSSEFNNGFEVENRPTEPSLFGQERAIKRSVDEADLSNPLFFGSGNRDIGAEIPSDYNRARDTTSSEPSQTTTRSARRTTSTSSMTSVDQAGTSDIKQHRERNRVAARKCRQKAKRNVAGLQRRERELSQQNKLLLSYVSNLREEILDLKTEILRHSECNSGIIQNYIANAARRQMG